MTIEKQNELASLLDEVSKHLVLGPDSIQELVQGAAEQIDPEKALDLLTQAAGAVEIYIKTLKNGGVRLNRLNRLCLAGKAIFLAGYEAALGLVAEGGQEAYEELRESFLNG